MTTRSGRFHLANLIAVWLMVASAWQVLAVDPVVSNVQAKQREGSRLVDITYDVVDPDSPTLTVYLKVSPDGGKTWKGPVELVSGDVGQHIVPGTAKKLVWDAGKEMPNQFGVNYRYRIGASDQWLAPSGMALIPAGPFQMGDERTEGPVHTVTVSAFSIDKTEVTVELWNDVKIWANKRGYNLKEAGSWAVVIGLKYPVHSVTWFDAVKWCNARSEKEGRIPAYYEDSDMSVVYRLGNKVPSGVKWNAGYRLPTEAEWEKAARGGIDGKLYPWGSDEITDTDANFSVENQQVLFPVGRYKPNNYGIYDMAGNVWEWCWDWKENYSINPQNDPRGPSNGEAKVIRGGSLCYPQRYCRVSDRYFDGPYILHYCGGFRSVLPPGQP